MTWNSDMAAAPEGDPVWVVWDMGKYPFEDEPQTGVRDRHGHWCVGQYEATDADLIAWSDAKRPKFTDWHLARLAPKEGQDDG